MKETTITTIQTKKTITPFKGVFCYDKRKRGEYMKRPDGLLKAGLIVNIVLSAFSYIGTMVAWGMIDMVVKNWQGTIQEKEYLLSLVGPYHVMLVVFGLIVPTVGIVLSVKALKEPKYRIAAGVLALLGNLIAGIFILIGKYNDVPSNNNYNQNYQNDQYNNLK